MVVWMQAEFKSIFGFKKNPYYRLRITISKKVSIDS